MSRNAEKMRAIDDVASLRKQKFANVNAMAEEPGTPDRKTIVKIEEGEEVSRTSLQKYADHIGQMLPDITHPDYRESAERTSCTLDYYDEWWYSPLAPDSGFRDDLTGYCTERLAVKAQPCDGKRLTEILKSGLKSGYGSVGDTEIEIKPIFRHHPNIEVSEQLFTRLHELDELVKSQGAINNTNTSLADLIKSLEPSESLEVLLGALRADCKVHVLGAKIRTAFAWYHAGNYHVTNAIYPFFLIAPTSVDEAKIIHKAYVKDEIPW